MKKVFKMAIISLIILFVGSISYLNYSTHFSKAARQGKANIEKIRKVKKGMNEETVIKIMGKPDLVDYCDIDNISKEYNYPTNNGSWIYVTVCFDSVMRVQEIYYPRN